MRLKKRAREKCTYIMEEIQELDYAGYSVKELWEDLDVCTSHIQEIEDKIRRCTEGAHADGNLYNNQGKKKWLEIIDLGLVGLFFTPSLRMLLISSDICDYCSIGYDMSLCLDHVMRSASFRGFLFSLAVIEGC